MQIRLPRWALSLFVLGIAVAVPEARAQTFPSKPIHFVVPFPAGGATDAAARAIQPQLEKILGQTVVIENRAGAGGTLGEGCAQQPVDRPRRQRHVDVFHRAAVHHHGRCADGPRTVSGHGAGGE